MRNPALDSVLRRRQCLPKNLTTKYLGTADIAAVTAEDILLDALESQERDQIVEDRMHLVLRAGPAAVDRHAGAADEGGIATGQEQRNLGDINGFTKTLCC